MCTLKDERNTTRKYGKINRALKFKASITFALQKTSLRHRSRKAGNILVKQQKKL
jgi:hypothetical protein